jgi:magnesium transporter
MSLLDPIGALDPRRTLKVVGRLVRRQVKRSGSSPGTLVHTGEKKMEQVRIRVIDYDEGELREDEVDDIREVWPARDSDSITWINVDGLHDVDLVRDVGEHFGLHPLVVEDIVHVGQRPKEEEYEGYLCLVLPMLGWDEATGSVRDEQLSLILGPKWVLTFQERVGDSFEPVRERLRSAKGRIRSRGPDYLTYALVDAVVDRYYEVLEGVGELTEVLELEVLDHPTAASMNKLHHLKRELVALRRSVWPVRDVMNGIIRSDTPLFHTETKVFVRDVYDHSVQVIESVEALRDVASGAVDLYLSNVSYRTNEVMKVLTIMASIFIPLTFMAGIYGMNFEYMPELAVWWAYPALWVAMISVATGLLIYFRRKGWL